MQPLPVFTLPSRSAHICLDRNAAALFYARVLKAPTVRVGEEWGLGPRPGGLQAGRRGGGAGKGWL